MEHGSILTSWVIAHCRTILHSRLHSIGVRASISDANISLIHIMNKITNIPMHSGLKVPRAPSTTLMSQFQIFERNQLQIALFLISFHCLSLFALLKEEGK